MTRPELRTRRLLLRPFRAADVDDALAYRNDEAFARYLPHVPQPFSRRDAEAFVARNMSKPWDRFPTFAVVLEARLIGTVNFEIDPEKRSAMLGYAFGRAWWGQGFAIEAVRGAVAWAAPAFGLHRVWASTDTRHHRSRRLLEKLGMRSESICKAARTGRDGSHVREIVYGLEARTVVDFTFAAGAPLARGRLGERVE